MGAGHDADRHPFPDPTYRRSAGIYGASDLGRPPHPQRRLGKRYKFRQKNGAGDGIRTHDFNLGEAEDCIVIDSLLTAFRTLSTRRLVYRSAGLIFLPATGVHQIAEARTLFHNWVAESVAGFVRMKADICLSA